MGCCMKTRPRWIEESRLLEKNGRVRVRRGESRPGGPGPIQGPVASSASASYYRSTLEAAFSRHLELMVKAGEIAGWKYEPFSLKLSVQKRYRPDFLTWTKRNGAYQVELIEVKGRWFKNRRDSLTRLYWAAHQFPMFTWRLVWKDGRGWDGQYITA